MSRTRSAFVRLPSCGIAIAIVTLSAGPVRPQQPSMTARRVYVSPCKPVDTPSGNNAGRIDRVTTTAVTLDRQWLSNPTRGQAELTKVLAGNPLLLKYAVSNSAACKGSSCACPRAVKGAATTLGQTLDPSVTQDASTAFTRLYRQDSVSTFTGAILFLREHPEFVRRVADSLGRASRAMSTIRPVPTTPARTRPPGA
jgi:hypothetical protein